MLALGGLGIALAIAIPVALIGLAIYSVWQLRKDDAWEQK